MQAVLKLEALELECIAKVAQAIINFNIECRHFDVGVLFFCQKHVLNPAQPGTKRTQQLRLIYANFHKRIRKNLQVTSFVSAGAHMPLNSTSWNTKPHDPVKPS
jgi:hypothetical protein